MVCVQHENSNNSVVIIKHPKHAYMYYLCLIWLQGIDKATLEPGSLSFMNCSQYSKCRMKVSGILQGYPCHRVASVTRQSASERHILYTSNVY